MTGELLVAGLIVVAVGYAIVSLLRLARFSWKRKTRKFCRVRLTHAGPRIVSLYVDLWLWKAQILPRKRKARR
jgi:hypothetical protein